MKTRYKIALLITWMAVIFWFSSEGHDASTSRSDAVVSLIPYAASWSQDAITFLTRKAAHMFIYFVLGVLMFNVVKDHAPTTRRALLLSVVFVAVYALSDEFHQTFIPGRSAELRDVLIDTTAGTAGILAYYSVAKLQLRRQNNAKV